MNTELLINSLKFSPERLRELLSDIPPERLKEHRIPGKWSIHENACHLALVDEMMLQRLERFMQEEHPEFKPYCPGEGEADVVLLDLDLQTCLEKYATLRRQLVEKLSTLTPDLWQRKAIHPEYLDYTPFIMARHVLLHDHLHMYRIEELWLTRDL
ncbi:MAG: DinB family protein [bacterium]|jgi:uncharacterized damage-inducible protein DinB